MQQKQTKMGGVLITIVAIIVVPLMGALIYYNGELPHDLFYFPSASGAHPYSHGYGVDYGTNDEVGTIMSYFDDQVVIFSNPNISICNSLPCGDINTADNARSLEEDKNLISAFRDDVNYKAFLNSVYLLLF